MTKKQKKQKKKAEAKYCNSRDRHKADCCLWDDVAQVWRIDLR